MDNKQKDGMNRLFDFIPNQQNNGLNRLFPYDGYTARHRPLTHHPHYHPPTPQGYTWSEQYAPIELPRHPDPSGHHCGEVELRTRTHSAPHHHSPPNASKMN